jgi:hypothetical protein
MLDVISSLSSSLVYCIVEFTLLHFYLNDLLINLSRVNRSGKLNVANLTLQSDGASVRHSQALVKFVKFMKAANAAWVTPHVSTYDR